MSDASAKVLSPLKAAIVRVTPFEQNCTLIWDEATKVGAVVDPGGDLDRIESAIKETGISVEKILLGTRTDFKLVVRHSVTAANAERKSFPVICGGLARDRS